MRILVTGASGFIGSHLTRALSQKHGIVAAVRNPERLKARFPDVRAVAWNFAGEAKVEDWLPVLRDIDVVINAVGIIRETRRQTFECLHHRAPCTLFMACRKAGVGRVIQISALGADEGAVSQYHRSKKAADDCLKRLDLNWVIVKPSLVYGPGGNSAAFFKALSALPLLPVVADGEQRIQPIHIDDLTRAICGLVSDDAPARLAIDAVGPCPIRFKEMLAQYRHWLGLPTARLLSIPYALAMLAAKIGGWFGNTPLSREAIQMLQRGNTGDASMLTRRLGIAPRSFDDALRSQPAEQADRWHARLFFYGPLLRIAIGLLWLFTGVVSLGIYPAEASYALLAAVGISGWLAPPALYGAALLDLALGVATLARYRIQQVGMLQILLMVAYSVLISTGLSEWWLHPFGPVTKNVPLIVATLIMMALEKN